MKNTKLLLKLLSGLIAVILWFAITYTEDPVISQNISGIRLILEGEDTLNANGFTVVNRDDIPDISVIIRGSRNNVISSLGSVYAVADVSAIQTSGKHQVEIRYSYLSSGITLVKTKTKTVELEIERIVTREIPVKISEITKENGLEKIVEPICKTENVTITGAESSVYKIAYAMAEIDTTSVIKSCTQEYVYKLFDEKGNVVSEENIIRKNRDTINVENVVYDVKREIPVKVVLNDANRGKYGFVVKTINKKTVTAGVKNGENIDYLEAVISHIDSDEKTSAELIIPEGVYVPHEDREIIVTGEFEEKTEKTVTAKIEAKNVPQGKKAVILPEEKEITVKTAEKNITLKAEADVSGIENEGTAELRIFSDKDADIVGTYTVFVKLETGE